MSRVTRGLARHKYAKKVMKAARGYRGGRHALYRTATETLDRARAFAYRDRRRKKRDFRSLWIQRINAGARINGMRYGQLIHGLGKAGIAINRKMLADLAMNDPSGFAKVVESAKQATGA